MVPRQWRHVYWRPGAAVDVSAVNTGAGSARSAMAQSCLARRLPCLGSTAGEHTLRWSPLPGGAEATASRDARVQHRRPHTRRHVVSVRNGSSSGRCAP